MDSPVCNWLASCNFVCDWLASCNSVCDWLEKENALKEDEVGTSPHNSYTFFGTFFSALPTQPAGAAICKKTTSASS